MANYRQSKSRTQTQRSADGGVMEKQKRAFDTFECLPTCKLSSAYREAQQAQIAGYAQVYGYTMAGFYVDHDSAKNTTGRPEYQNDG